MERPAPQDHISLVYARQFERETDLTKRLGFTPAVFRELTTLDLASFTLTTEMNRLQVGANSPGRKLAQKWLPQRLMSCIYGESIQELAEASDTKEYVTERVITIWKDLHIEERAQAEKLRDRLKNLINEGIINHNDYKFYLRG